MPRVLCPHCQQPLTTKRSDKMTDLLTHWDAVCTNPECAAVVFGAMVIEGQRRESLSPNPDIHLPIGRRNGHRT